LSLTGLLFGTELIEILQGLFAPQFDSIFESISLLGSDAVLVALSSMIYWCLDKRRGRTVTYVLFMGAYLNFFLKFLVPWPRPPVEYHIVEKSEIQHGFPSGHAQDSATFWSWIGLDFRKRILPILGMVIVVAVGLSRIYLGVHYPGQVIGGWIIGVAVAGLGMVFLRRLPFRMNEMQAIPQVSFAFVALVPILVAIGLGAAGEVNPIHIGGYLFGFSLGALAEDRYVRFKTEITSAKRILRVVVGSATTGFFVLVLDSILPETGMITGFINAVMRGLTVVVIAPAIFKVIERG